MKKVKLTDKEWKELEKSDRISVSGWISRSRGRIYFTLKSEKNGLATDVFRLEEIDDD